jgi:DTW domain-containing protein YfiP
MEVKPELKACSDCLKPQWLCICHYGTPRIKPPVFTLVLQHPQEPDKLLGSARLVTAALENSALRVGLSWANLKKATLGTAAPMVDHPKNWAVLYLGSSSVQAPGLTIVDKKGEALPDSRERLGLIKGLIVLDGTWSQAKALWWRNPWLLKCMRLVLRRDSTSLYGNLRKEPRKECLSSVEAVHGALSVLWPQGKESLDTSLREPFSRLLSTYRKGPQP